MEYNNLTTYKTTSCRGAVPIESYTHSTCFKIKIFGLPNVYFYLHSKPLGCVLFKNSVYSSINNLVRKT